MFIVCRCVQSDNCSCSRSFFAAAAAEERDDDLLFCRRILPLSLEGRKMADSWNLDKDNASGNQCKAYGAGGIVRIPGRARVAWDDDFTLRFEFDAGRQVRLLRFPSGLVQPAGGVPALQGHSVANWQFRNTGVPILNEETAQRRGRAGGRGPARAAKGSLKVVTTGMLPGYFRKNGLAYSGDARLTEYIDRHEDYGSQWFTVLSVLDDPRYLVSPFVTTTHFKREADASKWNPQPCETLTPIAPLPQGEN